MPAFRHPFLLRLLCCLAMVQQLAVAQDPVAPPATQAPTEPPKPPKEAKHARRKPNRLAAETSPYLLQHAHNPVDWRPWGPEALAHAKKQNKPILLSIGYSSCHWCHVMERESFVDEEIAKVMNANFVCIKIDREERPDIDKIYMTSLQVFLQLTNGAGNGGWPLTMFLTPDAKPFYGGSYFPARDGDRPGMPGFLTIVQGIAKVWKESPERVQQDADVLTRFTKRQLESTRFDADFEPDESFIASVQADLAKSYDEAHGGFGFEPNNDRRPKFPEPANLLFLIQRVRMLPETSEAKAQASSMLHGTLEKMAMGGIRDHVGGGFHRYSVDRRWDIPHFEKMLYDNGLLATVYAEAYALQPKSTYRRVLLQMTEFLQREMTADGGAFYAALDADSEGEEGSFYVWTRKEIQAILDDDEYQLAAPALGLNGPPNFEGPHYALRQSLPPARLAALAGLDEDTWATRLDAVHRKLLAHRSDRERPGTDFKILTAWNGLMIRGLADSGRILKEPSHIKMAERAATFLLDNLRTDDGQLRRSYAKGQAKLDAYLDDYAYLVHGLIGLHQATGDRRWLDAAQQLTDLQIRLFWDDEAKGFFYTATDHESLLARSRNLVDGARPSGNSVSANNLLYLAQHAEQPRYRQLALETMKSAAGIVERSPAAAPNMGAAAIRWRHQP